MLSMSAASFDRHLPSFAGRPGTPRSPTPARALPRRTGRARRPDLAVSGPDVSSRMRPKTAGAKANAPCAMPTISATARCTSSLTNSTWAISGGSDVALPKPTPNSTTPSQQQWQAGARRRREQDGPRQLECVAAASHEPPVRSDRHEPAEEGAAGDRHGRDEGHGEAGALRAERGRKQREEVRHQADLREQPQRHARRQRHEAAVSPQQGARQRHRRPRREGGRRRAGRISVGRQPHLLRRAGEEQVGQQPHGEHHDEADGGGRGREAQRADARHPQR